MKSFSIYSLLAMLITILFSASCVALTPVPAVAPAATVTLIPTAPTLAVTATLTVTLTPTPTATLTPTVEPTVTTPEATVLTLMVPSSFAENQALNEQVDNFQYQDSAGQVFRLRVELVSDSDYEAKLLAARFAGDLPDLFVLFNQRQIQEFHEELVKFAEDSDLLGQFLPGGIKSVSVDGVPYGLPWRRILCTSSYWHLVASARTDYTEAAMQAVIALTNGDYQKINYEQAYWFPTHVEVNNNTANCSPDSGELYTVAPDADVKSGIGTSDSLGAVIAQLEETLKTKESPITGAPLMREDTTFNLEGLTYIVNGENGEHVSDGRNNSAVLIPITEPSGLAGLQAKEAMSEALPTGLVLSALVYGSLKLTDNGEFVSFEADPERTYGLYVQSDDPLNLLGVRLFI